MTKPGTTLAEAEEYDQAMLRRQKEFRTAAEYVARAWAEAPSVQRIVLFGSVASPLEREAPRRRPLRSTAAQVLHECKDVDLAVWLTDLGGLRALQRACSDALQRLLAERGIGVANHQVDVFIMEPRSGRLLGTLCHFTECPKDGKPECAAPGCGSIPLLRRHEGFDFDPQALGPSRSILLFERPR